MRSGGAASSVTAPGGQRWRRLLTGEWGSLLALALVVVFFTIADEQLHRHEPGGGQFASIRNLRVVLTQTSEVAVAALGMTLVIIAGGIDLSAGTALTLCATMLAYGLKHDYPVAAALLLTLATGALCGLANGLLINLLSVPPFIVTLGTMMVYLGVGKIICNEQNIFPTRAQIPEWLQNLCSSKPPDKVWGFFPNIPPGVWLALGLAVVVALVLRYTVFGRHIVALGSNETAARLCGINTRRVKAAVYALSGLFVGIAGAYHFATIKVGNPVEGQGLELRVIAAVVIGGASLSGGRGSIIGTLAGAAIMAALRSGCDQLEVQNRYQDIIIGGIIVVAVALDQLRQRKGK